MQRSVERSDWESVERLGDTPCPTCGEPFGRESVEKARSKWQAYVKKLIKEKSAVRFRLSPTWKIPCPGCGKTWDCKPKNDHVIWNAPTVDRRERKETDDNSMASDTPLNLLVLRVADIDRAAEFYATLGLEFIKHRHGTGPEHYACERSGFVFELYPARDAGEEARGVRLGFVVDNVKATLDMLIERGAEVLSPPKDSPWGRRAVLRDPFGVTVELSDPAGVQPD